MRKNSRGFTLIEVLIAVTIMATMGTLAAQSIQQAIKSKKKIQEQLDITSRMRDGMRLLERDIQLAYHHRDWEKEMMIAMKKKSAQPATTKSAVPTTPQVAPMATSPDGTPDPFAGPEVEARRIDPVTQFMGSENELHFVTLNNGRMTRNTPQADYSEVGYTLKDCKSTDGKNSSKCLWRRTTPWVDKDVTVGGEEVVLLENVSEFSLKYLGKGKQDWDKTWKTNEAGDGATKGNFPLAVEISLTIEKPNEKSGTMKKFSMQTVVPIHFPNNPEEGSSNSSGGIDTTGGGGASTSAPSGAGQPAPGGTR